MTNRLGYSARMLPRFSTMAVCALMAATVPQSARAMVQEPDGAPIIPGATTKTIISDEEFTRDIPKLDAPPLETVGEWVASQEAKDPAVPADRAPAGPAAPEIDPLLDAPLPSIENFDAEPPPPTDSDATDAVEAVRFGFRVDGLGATADNPDGLRPIMRRFTNLSALRDRGGRADSRAEVAASARADRQLLLDILSSEGYFDASVEVDYRSPKDAPGLEIVLTAIAGQRFALGTVTFDAPEVEPADLIRRNFVPKPGDPIVADIIVAAETNIAITLPENGYPFAQVGQRDILLDADIGTGDYVLPVVTGPRSYFGALLTEGKTAFGSDHIAVLRRFETGDLYDSRKVDDLRSALVATGLFSTVAVKPIESGRTAPDGTPYADLLVSQDAGPARSLAASAGYGSGQGFRAEGSWTHRNLFPPEGALSANITVGTLEQEVGVRFSRSNAGQRDRNLQFSLSLAHSNFEAFDAYTGRIGATLAYVSTPIWQKKLTYAVGAELLATDESQFDFSRAARSRRVYYIAALPVQAGFDTSNDLLDPTSGYRLNIRLSPETSLSGGARFYARGLIEGSFYQSIGDNLVLAARARVGSIIGTSRASLPPSRRYYGGGGGSVRGFGYQQLGPRDPAGDPIGGRSLNEVSTEVRYRFGNFGVAGFVDAGQVYASSRPRFDDWRFGVGIGGRFYTNFGPMRVDVATPLNRQPGESKFTVYVSLGQAF